MRLSAFIRYAALTLLILPLWGNAATISADRFQTCALTSAGGVQCWGWVNNSYGKTPAAVSGLNTGVQAIAAGERHACALTAAGGVQCWGNNDSGQLGDGTIAQRLTPVAVSGLGSGVQAITAGSYHTCALTVAGGVQCWGSNNYGQLGDGTSTQRLTPVAVSGLGSGVQAIEAGGNHTCALTEAGAAQCWGYNYDGQLGDGTTTNRLTPVAVSGLGSGVQEITVGASHSCALNTAGVIKCWGDNGSFQLGNSSQIDSYTPTALNIWGQSITVTTAAPALAVIGESFPVAAVSSSGLPVTITASGGCSISGNTVTITSSTPFCTVTYTQVGNAEYAATTLSSISSVDTDGDGTPNAADTDDDNDSVLDSFDALPLDASDSLDADYDGIGNTADTDDDNDTLPDGSDNCSLVANLNQADSNNNGKGDACEPPAISAGGNHTCALTDSGGVQCWGYNKYGQLGDDTTTNKLAPVAVVGLSSGVQAITAGSYNTCALTAAGSAQCWGANGFGELGDGTTTQRNTPAAVTGLSSGVQAITAGQYHTCVLTVVGGVQCRGYNVYGQLGDGTTTNKLAPVAVSGLSTGVQAITAGDIHSCALTTAGGVQCWGDNTAGGLGDGTITDRAVPVVVSGLSSGVQTITAGSGHTCALTTAGGVQCWGSNGSGELGDGTTTQRTTPVMVSGLSSGVQAITAGSSHTCALTTAGAVKCWGRNNYGQLGDGTTTTRLIPVEVSGLSGAVQAITAGSGHTCALTIAGAMQCWGLNTFGQLGDDTTVNRSTAVTVKSGQVISVTTPAPALGVMGVGFPVAAISSSGLPVTVTASGGCSLSGNTVTITSATPFCTVTYTQAGNAEFGAALPVSSITSVDSDGDGSPNAIDTDDDADGVLDSVDAFPLDPSETVDTDNDGIGDNTDTDDDGDSVLDSSDNCPLFVNPDQADANANGIGNACEQPIIAAGYYHACALTTTGAVQCWGRNNYGQLGDGTTTDRTAPVLVSGLGSGVVTLAAGLYHTCALTTTGAVKCWGFNSEGQLGNGSSATQLTPIAVTGLSSGVQAIAAGDNHSCALTTTGGVKCWGRNVSSQIGDGTGVNRLLPVAVSGLSGGIHAITAGQNHSCALTTLGGVTCWGHNGNGQIGDGTQTTRPTPVAVVGLGSGVQAIVAGTWYNCALTTAGSVKCWGFMGSSNILTPLAASGWSSGVQAITAGQYHNCALMMAGGVQCRGRNGSGQLGDGTQTDKSAPVQVTGLGSGVQAIAANSNYTCALITTNGMKCWGSNTYGQLGDGSTTQRLIPIDVLSDSDGDGVLDAADAFPYDPTESLDTDNDGIGNNADMDDDGDGVPDYIDADPLNAAVNTERVLPLNSGFRGSSIQESVAPL